MLTIFLFTIVASLQAAGGAAEVRISNRHLAATCVAGDPAGPQRKWRVSAPTALTLTMRNNPRPGIGNTDPGQAMVTFTPEPGHGYDIEVRADPMTFSTRVWKAGEWTPVVRDRATGRIVSAAPRWVEAGCRN